MKKLLTAMVLSSAVLASSACGSSFWSDDGADYYTPVSYYQTVGNVYECYYFGSDTAAGYAQAYSLMNSGGCPQYSIPTQMPVSWAEMYFDYYSSAAYYNTYVPASYRRSYTSVTLVNFHRTYSTQIANLSKTAVYKSSSGSTTRGVPKSSSFTSGTSSKTVKYTVPSRSSSTRTYSSSSGRK